MSFIFELLFQFLGEIILQLLSEALIQLGFRSLASVVKRRPHPALAFIGCILWGAIAGVISLFIFPDSFIEKVYLHIINLIVTPLAIAFIIVLIGKSRVKKGKDIVSLDKFIYAYAFAFAMSYVRFEWATS